MSHRFVTTAQKFYALLTVLLFLCWCASAQTNPCNVTAIISPGNDTVVTDGSPVTFSSASINATSYKFIIDDIPYAPDGPVMIGYRVGISEIKLVAYNGGCTDTAITHYFYQGTFPPDTNNTKMYYGLADLNQSAKGLISLRNGDFLLIGDRSNNWWTNLPNRHFLMRIKESGCIRWAHMLDGLGQNTTAIYDAIEAANGDLFITGTTNYALQLVARLDASGNTLWSKQFEGPQNRFFATAGMLATADGGLILSGSSDFGFAYTVLRLNAAGNIVWQQNFTRNMISAAQMKHIVLKDNFLYLGGIVHYEEGPLNYYTNILTKLEFATGNHVWSKRFTGPQGEIAFAQMVATDTALMICGVVPSVSPGPYTLVSFFNIDTSGNVINASSIKQSTSYMAGMPRLVPLKDKMYYVLSAGSTPLPLQPYISFPTNVLKLDSNLNVVWAKHHGAVNLGQYNYAAAGKDDKLVIAGNEYGTGYSPWGSYRIAVVKIDSAGGKPNIVCNFGDWATTKTSETILQQPFQWHTQSNDQYSPVDYPASFTNIYPELKWTCPDYVDSCSMLRLSGTADVCYLPGSYTYKSHRNRGCGQPTSWSVSDGVIVVSQNDSSITVRFPNFGRYTIYGISTFGCVPMQDSLVVTAANPWPPLDLGRDTGICPGNSYTIDAGNAYYSYTWQDGSTDPAFVVTTPGQYWVEVVDYCGNTYRDTINISGAPQVPLSIGPDRTICIGDSVHLHALPEGYMSYQWQPGYNVLTHPQQHHIDVYPRSDTSYIVRAERSPGCYGYDTVHITVNQAPPIALGADTSFCMGDSVVLDAGPGFSLYQWSNGSSDQRITVRTTGNYSVTGTTLQGCKSRDTLRVSNVWPLPIVNLNKNPVLCADEVRTLDAGGGMISYNWNTGSNSQTISVSTTGTFSVSVIDPHGCETNASTEISTIIALPANFLPGDTALCSYGRMELKTREPYSSYLWSNGSTGAAITISQAGVYVLEVKDRNNCIGKDTVVITRKDCLTGFYIPNAFTPNNNGRNDTFKPLLFGNVVKYHFVIYNRWGQAVFQSDTPGQGWDGTIRGLLQGNNIFAWSCTYQFDGEPVKNEKGTVTVMK